MTETLCKQGSEKDAGLQRKSKKKTIGKGMGSPVAIAKDEILPETGSSAGAAVDRLGLTSPVRSPTPKGQEVAGVPQVPRTAGAGAHEEGAIRGTKSSQGQQGTRSE